MPSINRARATLEPRTMPPSEAFQRCMRNIRRVHSIAYLKLIGCHPRMGQLWLSALMLPVIISEVYTVLTVTTRPTFINLEWAFSGTLVSSSPSGRGKQQSMSDLCDKKKIQNDQENNPIRRYGCRHVHVSTRPFVQSVASGSCNRKLQ